MASGSAKTHGRIAAAILATLMVAFAVFTYLSYNAAFTPTKTVTVTSERAGLVMERGAKVKYRGIQVGKVNAIEYAGNEAKLTLLIDSSEIGYIPSNATVKIEGTTIFGAKSVEFFPPDKSSGKALADGATVPASSVQLEVNTLFQTLVDLLQQIDPGSLNGVVTAVSEGLRGHGEDAGEVLVGVSGLAAKLNPKMGTVQSVFQQTAQVGDLYNAAAPDLVALLDNVPSLSNTIVDQQQNLNATLVATTGLANNGYETLEPAAADFIAAIQRLRAPLQVMSDYSPEFGCLFQAFTKAIRDFAPIIGGIRPGLFVSSNFLLGSPSYTFPESLPLVGASGGPNCRGLPNFPNKQFGGSWYRSPFLVTNNANVPYEPFTELQFDAPSTVQFLFNGAFAERDDF